MIAPVTAHAELVALIREAERILIFTGAGISTGSGIPDYRGPRGVWKTKEPVMYQDFMSSDAARREYWAQKAEGWASFRDAEPNATHAAIVTLERAGKSVDQLVAEKGDLAKALEEQKKRMEELRKAQEAAQKRAALLQQLMAKFQKMIDAGELTVVVRNGRLVLQLRNDVLFDSGQVTLKDAGKNALKEVAKILKTLNDRDFQVAGHTDNVPISTQRFPSNWELSAARAVNVVKFLEDEGVAPGVLSAAGYSEYDPVAANESSDGKAKNRRIEIVLQPNLAELVKIPGLKEEK